MPWSRVLLPIASLTIYQDITDRRSRNYLGLKDWAITNFCLLNLRFLLAMQLKNFVDSESAIPWLNHQICLSCSISVFQLRIWAGDLYFLATIFSVFFICPDLSATAFILSLSHSTVNIWPASEEAITKQLLVPKLQAHWTFAIRIFIPFGKKRIHNKRC